MVAAARFQIYHPNINLEGAVCLNILRAEWKPVFDLNTIVSGLTFLFYEPNGDDPLNKGTWSVCRERGRAFRLCLTSPCVAASLCLRVSHHTEAAALFRDNEPEFRRVVRRTLRGDSVGGERFPRLL